MRGGEGEANWGATVDATPAICTRAAATPEPSWAARPSARFEFRVDSEPGCACVCVCVTP